MAYDEVLAARIREAIGDDVAVREQRMFGGLAFLVGGNMAVAASGTGGLMVRVDPARSEGLTRSGIAEPMRMGGRTMAGWLLIDASAVAGDDALATWVERGVRYASSLPAKSGGER